jgi:hypothetical protein
MKNLFKRLVNTLMIIGTLLGLWLLTLPTYQYKLECLGVMVFGYALTAAVNYILFNSPRIWNTQE